MTWCIPQGLEVLAWRIGDETPEFLPVSTLTVRDYDGPGVTVHLRDGAAPCTATADHPFVVLDDDRGAADRRWPASWSAGMRVPRVAAGAAAPINPIPGLGGPSPRCRAAGAARGLGSGGARGRGRLKAPCTRWRCRRPAPL